MLIYRVKKWFDGDYFQVVSYTTKEGAEKYIAKMTGPDAILLGVAGSPEDYHIETEEVREG